LAKRRTPYLSHYLKDNVVPFKKLAVRTVVDPYDGTLTKQHANTRGDILGEMYARGFLKHHQFEIARFMEGAFERAEVTKMRSVDVERTPVSGGGSGGDRFHDGHARAFDVLAEAREALGADSYRLIECVLRERNDVPAVAKMVGYELRIVAARFRAALDKLATTFGHAGEGPERKRVKDKYSAMVGKVIALKTAEAA
jgi:hypothetical protein